MDFLLELAWKNAAVAGVLALVAALVGRFGRRPALTHALWLLVMLKLVTPPLWQLAVPWPKGDAQVVEVEPTVDNSIDRPLQKSTPALMETVANLLASSITAEQNPTIAESSASPVPATDTLPLKLPEIAPLASVGPSERPREATVSWITWKRGMLLVWASGSSLWLFVLLVRLRRFRGLVGLAVPASEADVLRVKELAEKIGLHRSPTLRLLNARVPPMTWGFARRREMLVPAYLWTTLPAAQRDALVLHELAHLRRGDHWVRQFELLVFVLHWWHPVSWWARHELQKAEEECCDAMVVRGLPEIAGDYAELIVETVAYLAQPPSPALPPLASGLGHIRHVRKRLTSILGGSTSPRLSRLAWLGLAVTGVFLLPMIPTTSRDALANAVPEGSLSPVDSSSLRMGLNPTWTGTTAGDGTLEHGFTDSSEENLAIMKLQLVQREAELTEGRLLFDQAARLSQRASALVARGAAALEVFEQSVTEQKVREARVSGREAAVKELRLLIKREESRLAKERGQQLARAEIEPRLPASKIEPPPVSSVDPSEQQKAAQVQRIDRLEHRLDALIAEARTLAEELKRERSTQK